MEDPSGPPVTPFRTVTPDFVLPEGFFDLTLTEDGGCDRLLSAVPTYAWAVLDVTLRASALSTCVEGLFFSYSVLPLLLLTDDPAQYIMLIEADNRERAFPFWETALPRTSASLFLLTLSSDLIFV